MRVVIDTNLWLSGLMLPGSVPGHIVRAASMAQITAVLGEPMLQELRLALHYRRVRPRIVLSDEEIERCLDKQAQQSGLFLGLLLKQHAV